MIRSDRLLAGLGSLLVALLAGIAPVAATPGAVRQDDRADVGTGLEGASACFRDSKHLIVSVVVDESKSLFITDPDGERVDAVLTAVEGLAELRESVEGAEVEIGIGVFGDPFVPLLPFTSIVSENMAEIREVAASLEDRYHGTETDLVTAMADAHEQLNDRASEITALGGADPCSLILLFTDGGYNLERRGGPSSPESTSKFYAPGEDLSDPDGLVRAMDLGVDALCREGGIIDSIRADGVTVMSVMLEEVAGLADADLLRALTLGTGGDRTCGRPDDNIRGAFFVAADADLLIARFHEMATTLSSGVPVPGDLEITVCDEDRCDEGTRSVTVDPLTRRIRLLALTPQSDLAVRIDGPAGDAIVEADGVVSVGSVSGSARSVAGRGLTIDLDRPEDEGGDGWEGTWSFTVIADDGEPDTPGLLHLYLYSDLALDLEVGPLTRGGSGELTVVLDVPDGHERAGLLEEARVTARFEDPLTGRAHVIELDGPPDGPYTGRFEVPGDLRTGGLRASAAIEAVYVSGGRAVAAADEIPVAVRRPGDSIQFLPAELEWPTLTGDGGVSTVLTATAGDGGGCVWFDTAQLVAPEAAGALVLTYDGREVVDAESCIEVGAGAETDIEIALETEHRASGSIRGHLVVHENGDGEASVTDIVISGRLHRGIDQARRVIAAAILLLAGLLLPIGLLHVVNRIGARFQRLDAVRGTVLPVRVTGRTIHLVEGERSRPLTLPPERFESLEGHGSNRDFTFGGIRFRARPSRNPFGPTMAMAAPEGGAERLRGRIGRRVELEASLAGSWVFLLDPDRTRRGMRNSAEGRLIAFIHENAGADAHHRLLTDVQRRLPETASALGAAVWSHTVKRPRRSSDADAEPTGAVDDEAGDDPIRDADEDDGSGGRDRSPTPTG